ncbi:Transmembrane protein [Phytophthora cinnamomi]|uniref:Transmembrane protein n=1 Tax=Phytophthora cinnamomi TaxID=4785 RepID=UPI0035597722|nr:Transmembrane protein [Phytophthora cinnamomi]
MLVRAKNLAPEVFPASPAAAGLIAQQAAEGERRGEEREGALSRGPSSRQPTSQPAAAQPAAARQERDERMEYEVTWGDGPLGLTLRPDLGEDMPPVVGRITRQDSAAALAKVAVGHMLVSINGMDTARQGYDHVVQTLQTIPRPAALRFRLSRRSRGSTGTAWSESGKSPSSASASSTARRREQYTVVWTEGPLGMILRPDDDDCHVPCIRKITGKGAGTGMERATVGDILVAVNGQETKSLGFRSTISLLKTIRKPAVLKFKRMGRRLSRKRSSQESPGGSRSVSGIPSDIGSYDIVWREGDLGLKLKPGYRDVPVLSKLTGKGNASGLQNAQVGDELVSVNGTLVDGEAYQDTLRMLKHSPKPAVLRFRPGKSRRESMMSVASVTSVRSNPGTQREVRKVSSRQHVPLYDNSAPPTEPVGPPPPPVRTERVSRSDRERSDRDRERADRERQKRKKRIPLDVARELVAASQGSDLDHAIFAGIPITAIEEGSKEAHLLRVQAKLCISNQAKTERTTPAKEALSRAEQEAKVLQEALEKVKSQAKKYEEILEAQSRERVLALAVRHKPEEVVKRQNNVIHELAGVISGFKRDSYTEVDIVPPVMEDNDHVQKIMDDLQNVMSIPVVVPTAKFCAECGATENESKLDMDDDGEYYCKDCWDKFLNLSGSTPVQVEEEEAVQDALSKPVSRMTIEDREAEEQKARIEAERKLMEIKELRRSGSMMPERPLHKNNAERSRRERRGLEELAQALLEEEERARAEGNLGLAKKLSAQRARTMAEASSENAHPGMTPFSSMGNLLSNHDSEIRNGHGSSTKSKSASPITDTPLALSRSISADSCLPPPVPVSVSPVTSPEPAPSPVAKHHHEMAAAVAVGAAATAAAVAMAPASPTARTEATASSSGGNDYADVNSDEEAEDQMHMSDEEDVLREVEEKNFALARQLDEAHSVIERARMSISMIGDDDDDDANDDDGLSEEQISLFKKLTSQAEERMSMVDRLHPQDDSDSDSDSDSEEEEEEEDEGVWI